VPRPRFGGFYDRETNRLFLSTTVPTVRPT